MTYRCSRARREFDQHIEQALRELTPLYKTAQKQGVGEKVLAAYYIFAYSQFEVYVKSFVEDSVNALNQEPPAFENLPDLMLGYLLHKSHKLAAGYRRYVDDGNEGAIIEIVAEAARKVASWSGGASSIVPFDAADFLEKKKYPSPKNLPQLFRRMGVKAIWGVIGRAGKLNGELVLTSLNDLRTNIAHEGKVPPGFSFRDFRDRLTQMRRFVAALDRGISTHFCSGTIRRSAWNSCMC